MPEGIEPEEPKSRRRCSKVRDELKMCLLQSECCQKHKKTPRQCILDHDETVSEECFILRNLFFECKRSLIDGRRRFRGPRDY